MATIRKEILTKRLATIIKDSKPNDDVRAKRSDGIVEVNRCPMAKILVEGPIDYRIEWNLNKIAEFELDREAITTKLGTGSPSSAEVVSWG